MMIRCIVQTECSVSLDPDLFQRIPEGEVMLQRLCYALWSALHSQEYLYLEICVFSF